MYESTNESMILRGVVKSEKEKEEKRFCKYMECKGTFATAIR